MVDFSTSSLLSVNELILADEISPLYDDIMHMFQNVTINSFRNWNVELRRKKLRAKREKEEYSRHSEDKGTQTDNFLFFSLSKLVETSLAEESKYMIPNTRLT